MNPLLSENEFTLTDKLERPEYLEGRIKALRRLYRKDPHLAREVMSYAWPHERERAWTKEELRAKLWGEGAQKVAELLFKGGASAFLASALPSVSAAFDAFNAERDRQDALAAQADAMRYPALAYTQPMAMQYAMGGGAPIAPPTHHHHRRHHHG